MTNAARTPASATTETPAELAADLQDERLIREEGLGGAVRAFGRRVRGGDLGSLPVVIGLAVIWVVFQILNPNFLSANNLVNLTLQCAAIGTISIGIVLVLLLGQIDLSVGSVSGVAAAILGVGFTQLHWPLWLTVIVAILAGSLIGLLYGFLFTRFGVPSFVITLAGLLGFLGLQLWILGAEQLDQHPLRLVDREVRPAVVPPAVGGLHSGRGRGRWDVPLRLAPQRAPSERRAVGGLDGGGRGQGRAAAHRPRHQRLVPVDRPRDRGDVPVLRGARHRDELPAHAHQVGPLGVRRRRFGRGGAPRRASG